MKRYSKPAVSSTYWTIEKRRMGSLMYEQQRLVVSTRGNQQYAETVACGWCASDGTAMEIGRDRPGISTLVHVCCGEADRGYQPQREPSRHGRKQNSFQA